LAGLDVGGVGYVGGTVVRTHIMVSLSSAAADTNPGFYWGLIIYGKDRVGVNVPPVNTDFYLDWLMLRESTPGTTPQSWQDATFAHYLYGGEFDVRAKRKVPQMDDSLFFALYNAGTAAGAYTIFARTLIALP
jgi:hypothetical protein